MSHPRGLSEEEATAWEKVSATVDPLHPVRTRIAGPQSLKPTSGKAGGNAPVKAAKPKAPSPARTKLPPVPAAPPPRMARRAPAPGHLDASWDKRLKAGDITPDLSLDLHDHGLDAAYTRLMRGMEQASSLGARVVLVVTGRSRPVDPADRATRRGAIRAKILDWLAASEHGGSIAAIRKAHRRHGADGALYIVLRRNR